MFSLRFSFRLLAFILIFLSHACTNKNVPFSVVKLKLPTASEIKKAFTKANKLTLSIDADKLCFAANVTGSKISTVTSSCSITEGKIAGTVKPGSTLELTLATGQNVQVDLLAFLLNSSSESCPDLSSTGWNLSSFRSFQVGSVSDIDLDDADESVSIDFIPPDLTKTLVDSGYADVSTCSLPVAENSEISADDPGIADGVTPLLVTVVLKDASDSPVVDMIPQIIESDAELSSLNGDVTASALTFGQCSASDSEGVSVCPVISDTAETVTVQLEVPDSLSTLSTDISFDDLTPPPLPLGSLVLTSSTAIINSNNTECLSLTLQAFTDPGNLTPFVAPVDTNFIFEFLSFPTPNALGSKLFTDASCSVPPGGLGHPATVVMPNGSSSVNLFIQSSGITTFGGSETHDAQGFDEEETVESDPLTFTIIGSG